MPAHFRASSMAAAPLSSASAAAAAGTYQPGHAAHASLGGGGAVGHHGHAHVQPSPALLARIAEKKQELANLRELRDSSAELAGQMETLEAKLRTLSDGTAAVACVLGNWGSVLQAISLASSKIPRPRTKNEQEPEQGEDEAEEDVPLPETLVRIPIEQADAAARAAGTAVTRDPGE